MGAINGTTPYRREVAVSKRSNWYESAKRLIDVVLSGSLLVLLLPFLIPISIAILLDSRGSVFYRRQVVGQGGKLFDALKLRTMVENGDHKVNGDHKLAQEYNNNHKLRSDPRVTRIGKLLRKTSIDELPQLWNVFKGDMSLVGPRMISFPELEKFGPWQSKILEIKPGITGLWQVNGRGELDYEERVRMNVYYVDNRSLVLDAKILARTIPAVLTARGAF
ncbi:MAG TPA: sugar transferase [Armatimonadota bacterium]|nr:sugar transferase [Armatimonadota bacterium]